MNCTDWFAFIIFMIFCVSIGFFIGVFINDDYRLDRINNIIIQKCKNKYKLYNDVESCKLDVISYSFVEDYIKNKMELKDLK